MNYRGDEDAFAPAYELPQPASVRAASARLAGVRSRLTTAPPMRADERAEHYRGQGGTELTAKQRRRLAKKQRKAGAA